MRDEVRVPPWLRVHWRKAHPEMKYDAADPTGGYPFVLKEVHEWMREHPYLEPGAREPDVGPDGQITEAGIDTTVGTNARISGSQTSARA